jgi:peptidylprolyl isomerase
MTVTPVEPAPRASATASTPTAPPWDPEDRTAPPPVAAERSASGLVSMVVKRGAGKAHPGEADKVTVHYSGWTMDGRVFDSSRTRGEPATFPLDHVIQGWSEGVQLMVVGETRRLWIPANLAYGNHPRHAGAPSGDLVFDVELLAIDPAGPKAAAAPDDVASPPPTATMTPSGLAYRVLQPGGGGAHPKATDRVKVHYTGWAATDGTMFDSSIPRGAPSVFPLQAVIAGWTEGVQLMTVGEKCRFWVPAQLAYGNTARPGVPTGMLVFDIELLGINP